MLRVALHLPNGPFKKKRRLQKGNVKVDVNKTKAETFLGRSGDGCQVGWQLRRSFVLRSWWAKKADFGAEDRVCANMCCDVTAAPSDVAGTLGGRKLSLSCLFAGRNNN